MRLYRLRSRTGFCIYSEQGRDCGKFINDLRNSPLKFFGLSVRCERLYGYVGSGDFKHLCRLAEEHKLVCEKIDEKGAAKSFRPFKRRIGLVIGFFSVHRHRGISQRQGNDDRDRRQRNHSR